MKRIFFLILIISVLITAACSSSANKKNEIRKHRRIHRDPILNKKWNFVCKWAFEDGTYKDADKRDEPVLDLKKDGTFTFAHKFINMKDSKNYTDSGTWKLVKPGDPKQIVLTITKRDGNPLARAKQQIIPIESKRWNWYLKYNGEYFSIK